MLILRHFQPIKREFNHNLFLENSHHITVFFRKGPIRAPVFVTFKILFLTFQFSNLSVFPCQGLLQKSGLGLTRFTFQASP